MPALTVYHRRMAAVLAALVSGLFGSVVLSPATPVCQAGQPCTAPAAGVTLTFVHNGVAVRSVVTSKAGTYRVLLPAGAYSVRVASKSRVARLTPATVRVREGVVARRGFTIDTGIR